MRFKIRFIVLSVIFCGLFFLNTEATAAGISNSHSAVDTSAHVIAASGVVEHALPTPYMVLPFILLLLMIATGPLFYKHFWEKHYPKVSILLGVVVVGYYIFLLNNYHSVLHTFTEYISFIALLSSLFVASGGILIKVDRKSTPILNVMFLLSLISS